MRSIGGRTGVGMPVSPAVSHAYGRSSIRTTAVYLETFDKADGALGPLLTWNNSDTIPAEVISNRCSLSGTFAAARAEHDTATADMYVQCDWVDGDVTNNDIFLIGRCGNTSDIDTDDGYYVFIFKNGTDVEVTFGGWGSVTGTGSTQVLSSTSALATWRFELQGTALRCYRDGVLVHSDVTGTMTGSATGTRAGFYFEAGGSPKTAFDNFEFYGL